MVFMVFLPSRGAISAGLAIFDPSRLIFLPSRAAILFCLAIFGPFRPYFCVVRRYSVRFGARRTARRVVSGHVCLSANTRLATFRPREGFATLHAEPSTTSMPPMQQGKSTRGERLWVLTRQQSMNDCSFLRKARRSAHRRNGGTFVL